METEGMEQLTSPKEGSDQCRRVHKKKASCNQKLRTRVHHLTATWIAKLMKTIV